jgi:hypothetical protein
MQYFEFTFDKEQISELFLLLDADKNFKLSFKEFNDRIFDFKVDIPKVLRHIRREMVASKINI